MPVAKNDTELMMMLMDGMGKSFSQVSSDLVDIVKDNVERYVYDVYMPRAYDRSYSHGGFMGSWTFQYTENNGGNNFEMAVFSDKELMDVDLDPEKPKHSLAGDDSRELMDTFIADGWGYAFTDDDLGADPTYYNARDYWTPAMDQFRDEEIAIAMRALKKNGFNITKVGI